MSLQTQGGSSTPPWLIITSDQVVDAADLSGDLTYPRTSKTCPKCMQPNGVFFQSRARGRESTMKVWINLGY